MSEQPKSRRRRRRPPVETSAEPVENRDWVKKAAAEIPEAPQEPRGALQARETARRPPSVPAVSEEAPPAAPEGPPAGRIWRATSAGGYVDCGEVFDIPPITRYDQALEVMHDVVNRISNGRLDAGVGVELTRAVKRQADVVGKRDDADTMRRRLEYMGAMARQGIAAFQGIVIVPPPEQGPAVPAQRNGTVIDVTPEPIEQPKQHVTTDGELVVEPPRRVRRRWKPQGEPQ